MASNEVLLGRFLRLKPERHDGIASEAAAFTRAKLSEALAAAGLDGMDSGCLKPLPYLQTYWMFGSGGRPSAATGRRSARLRGRARREAAWLRSGFTAKRF
ncbi:MAG: hypothetical protein J2P31_09955 [Blastocatellia bacterium]|nr:hypothetical protein [Blastocatellia bacterium]